MEESASPEEPATTSDWRASLTAVAGVLGAVALMLLLVTWAATIGPEEVVRGKGNPPTNMSVPPKATATVPANPGHERPQGGGDSDVLFTLMTLAAVTLATVVMLAVLLSVARWLMAREWKLRRREPEPEELAFDPLEAPALLARAMVVDAPTQRELLASGSARNAIVACWHRFEEQAAVAGVQRRPWETSSEFTLRVLDKLSADGESVLRLADLYRAARHSTHEITEDDRASALAALDVVHRSLGHTARSHSRGGG